MQANPSIASRIISNFKFLTIFIPHFLNYLFGFLNLYYKAKQIQAESAIYSPYVCI